MQRQPLHPDDIMPAHYSPRFRQKLTVLVKIAYLSSGLGDANNYAGFSQSVETRFKFPNNLLTIPGAPAAARRLQQHELGLQVFVIR